MTLPSAPTSADSGTVEHLLKPADPEVAELRFALDQIGISLSTSQTPPRRSLPEVATELLRVVQNPKTDVAAIERIVSRDPFVSAQVLSVANSALYSPRSPITSIKDAAVRIGMEAVRDIALMVITTSRMFRVAGLERQTTILCNRAVVTAVASRKIAQLLGANTDFAFLAGLLHDVGHLLILEQASNDGLVSRHLLGNADLLTVLFEKSGQYHQSVGAVACAGWKLPQAAVDAALFHHRYRHEGKHYLAAHLVAVADTVADALGVGCTPLPITADHPPFSDMGLKPAMVKALLEETRAISVSLGVPI
ncbi:MAG: HDOD domain-containing protein [Deltaproteobacteria bacterium]|nr:HDOD domain-containing protein [Deltaproteobacteria bacterium]